MKTDFHERQKELETLEHTLHDRLAEITRRITNTRATLKIYEDALQKTLAELTNVRSEMDEMNRKLEASWNRTGRDNGQGENMAT